MSPVEETQNKETAPAKGQTHPVLPLRPSRAGLPVPEGEEKVFVYFSELLGRPVVDDRGDRVGRLADLKVRLGESFPRMSSFLVRTDGKVLQALEWSEVADFTDRRIALRPGAREKLHPPAVKSEEILLKEELLDKQVVDTHGAKIERVNDIHLLVLNRDLRLVHVDIGRRGILRRLGLLKPIDALTNWLFEYRMAENLISWKFIQPLASDPNKKDLKLNVTTRRLHDLHPSELADILEDLDRQTQARIFKSLDLETAADTLQEVDPKLQVFLLAAASLDKASDLLEEMDPDEAADLLSELPDETQRKLIQTMDQPEREVVEELLKFKEGTAGSLMTTDFISVHEDQTVGDAVQAFRESSHPLESAAYIYVTDAGERLVGVITLRHLILMDRETPVKSLMNAHLVKVETEDDAETVADLFGKYKFLMIPVVDKDSVMEGVITFQDIIEGRCRL